MPVLEEVLLFKHQIEKSVKFIPINRQCIGHVIYEIVHALEVLLCLLNDFFPLLYFLLGCTLDCICPVDVIYEVYSPQAHGLCKYVSPTFRHIVGIPYKSRSLGLYL